jgi:hypothetical protein
MAVVGAAIWTGSWTGASMDLDWPGQWELVTSGVSSCGTPAVSGAWTRLRASEPIDRRSWPAGVPIELVWCDYCVMLDSGAEQGPDCNLGLNLDGDNGWNGGPDGAWATRDGGGWASQAVKPNGPVPGGEGSWVADPPLPGRIPSSSNSRRHLATSPMRGGGRGQRVGARVLGSAQSACGGTGPRTGGTDPVPTRRQALTELGGWPTRGLPMAWQRGPATRLLHCGGAGTGAHGWQRQSHGMRADNGRCRSVGPGWRSMPSPPEHCRLLPNVQDPGWPPLESRTWAGGG